MTAIYYPDFSRTSPDGRFHLDVRSPDNEPIESRRPAVGMGSIYEDSYQHDFVYTLKDTEAYREVWTREQNESSPQDAFVSNDGWVVVRTHCAFISHLLFVDPVGVTVQDYDLMEGLLKDDPHVSWGSAGPSWADNAFAFYIRQKDVLHFCIQLSWGRRLQFELRNDCVRPIE